MGSSFFAVFYIYFAQNSLIFPDDFVIVARVMKMIFDKISNASLYYDSHKDLKLVADFVAKFNESNMEDGTYEIDGKRVFATIQSFRSKQQTPDMMFEAHRDYIDVQYIAKGMEKIRYANLDDVQLVEEHYSKGKDIAFYEGDAKMDFALTAGTFLLLEPADAHLPGLSVEKDCFVRKIVFKIHV